MRTSLAGFLLATAVALCATTAVLYGAADGGEKPNLIFLFSDQHRMADFPGEPHSDVIAPNLERLSRGGATFVNAISNYPVCSPYRGMLISGRAPFRTGVVENRIRLRDEGDSFGHVFKNAGYRTGYIGKWHLAGEDAPEQGHHGFEHYQPWIGTSQHTKSSYWDSKSGRYVRTPEYNPIGMVDQALSFIEERKGEPFLLMVSMNPPHANFFDAPPEFQRLYQGKELSRRPNFQPDEDPDPGASRQAAPTKKELDRVMRGYLAHISALDHELGRLLDWLEENDLASKTIVVYSSDHGEMHGSHGSAGKRQPFEESIRIPFVVLAPGRVSPGLRPETPIGNVDFLPTLASLAGVPFPDDLDGRDLSAALRGEEVAGPDYQPIMHIFNDLAGAGPGHPAPIFRGVRTQRYAYAAAPGRHFMLYDLERDPYQLHNLVDEPANAELRGRLAGLTAEWLKRWDDPFLMPRQ